MCATTSKNGTYMCRWTVGSDYTGFVPLSYFLLSSNVLENCSLFFEVMLNFAEFLTKDFGYGDQEAGVLIQAIMSIKSIIKQDPPSHEKVSFSCLFYVKLWPCVSSFLSVYFG